MPALRDNLEALEVNALHQTAHRFSTDPAVQYKFNAFFTVFWIILMVLAPFMPPFHFITTVTDQFGSHTHIDGVALGALLIFEVSLWANAFTHFGALGANVAAMIAGNHPKFQPKEDVIEDYQAAAAEVFDDELINADDDGNWLFAEDDVEEVKVPVISDLSRLTGQK